MERKAITICDYCGKHISPNYESADPDRYLICHHCGNDMDNATDEELISVKKYEDDFRLHRVETEKRKRYALYLDLKKEFEGETL